MTPQQYCQQKAARSGSSFYSSFLALPKDKREAIIALYAFCREVDDIADGNGDTEVRRAKLQWWRDEIRRLFTGAGQHPVTRALTPVIKLFNLPEEHFLEIIDGMQMDLDNARYANYPELNLYCHRVAGIVGLMSAEIFGYRDRNTLKYAHELGMAMQLTNILRDVREDAVKGRVYLPLEELARHGIKANDVMAREPPPALRKVFEAIAMQAQTHYVNAFRLLPEADRYAQRAGIIMAEVYQTLLHEIRQDGYQVMHYRISLPSARKLWIAWATRWREWWRHRRHLRSP